MTSRADEIQALLDAAKRQYDSSVETALSRELSRTWEAVMAAHDRTSVESVPLRENGLLRDFYLLAMEDLADAQSKIEDGMASLARLMVNDLNIARTTVSDQAHVSRSKMLRWLGDE